MDKQILFYSSEYQFYYSPKNNTISSPQISGKHNDDYIKNWVICFGIAIAYWICLPLILPLLLMTNIFFATLIVVLTCILIKIFSKAKIYFEFGLKGFWYVFFVPLHFLGWFLTTFTFAFSEIKISTVGVSVMYEILFIMVGICISYKKKIILTDEEKYVTTPKNKKMLRDVLISNDVDYKGVIILEVIVLVLLAYLSLSIGILQFLMFFVPLFIVAIFQKNIYYLFLIRKIAKQYGISLKSKDVLAENDAETEKQIDEEKEITTQAETEKDTEIENKTETENKTNTEINTQISTENNKSNQNDKNADAKKKEDINTESEITTDTPLTSTQNQNKTFDK